MNTVECLPSLSYDLINFRPHFDHARIHADSMFLDPGERTGSAYYKIDNERRCHMKILHAIHGCLVHTFAIIGAASSIDAWRTQPTPLYASNMASIILPAPHRQDICTQSSTHLSASGRCCTAENACLSLPAVIFGLVYLRCHLIS